MTPDKPAPAPVEFASIEDTSETLPYVDPDAAAARPAPAPVEAAPVAGWAWYCNQPNGSESWRCLQCRRVTTFAPDAEKRCPTCSPSPAGPPDALAVMVAEAQEDGVYDSDEQPQAPAAEVSDPPINGCTRVGGLHTWVPWPDDPTFSRCCGAQKEPKP